jgi:hypothetical protein
MPVAFSLSDKNILDRLGLSRRRTSNDTHRNWRVHFALVDHLDTDQVRKGSPRIEYRRTDTLSELLVVWSEIGKRVTFASHCAFRLPSYPLISAFRLRLASTNCSSRFPVANCRDHRVDYRCERQSIEIWLTNHVAGPDMTMALQLAFGWSRRSPRLMRFRDYYSARFAIIRSHFGKSAALWDVDIRRIGLPQLGQTGVGFITCSPSGIAE